MTKPTRMLPLFLALSLGCGPSSQEPLPEGDVIAFVHANVVPMDEERVLPDQTVLVAKGKIIQVGPTSVVRVPKGAFRVDAKGRYLLPALSDMHVHLLGPSWNDLLSPEAKLPKDNVPDERFLLPYIANGVTTVQVLSATPENLTVRGRIERGELLGPRLILARMIEAKGKAWPPPLSVWVDSAETAREAVRQAKAEGYDMMKVYSFLSLELYDAIVATAKELGMEVVGHLPASVSLEHALESGQKLIAHSEEVTKQANGQYDPAKIDHYAARMAEGGVWMAPTLVTTETLLDVLADPDDLYSRPETAYFRHPAQVGIWSFIVDNLYRKMPTDKPAALRCAYEEGQLPLTKAFHQKGGKILAGSDALLPGILAGFDLHRELQSLVRAGLTPYEALRTATTNPSEYLGESDKTGTIAVGKHSDLLLVDANPLEDISAASEVAGVLVRGRWLGAAELDRKMQEIAAPEAAGLKPAQGM